MHQRHTHGGVSKGMPVGQCIPLLKVKNKISIISDFVHVVSSFVVKINTECCKKYFS